MLSRRRREMDGYIFRLVNDVIIAIISVVHSFGQMDFRCGGLDLSMLCDKLGCFRCSCCGTAPAVSRSPGPQHCDGFGKTSNSFNHCFCRWASTLAGCCNCRSDKRAILQQVCPGAAEQKRSCPPWLDFYPLI